MNQTVAASRRTLQQLKQIAEQPHTTAQFAVAGLIDGVNPCAFATIIFLISMLAFLVQGKREMLTIGFGFTFAVFGIKTYFFVIVYIWVRWTVPRFRYDQIMDLCWKMILPLSIANILVTGALVLWIGGLQ